MKRPKDVGIIKLSIVIQLDDHSRQLSIFLNLSSDSSYLTRFGFQHQIFLTQVTCFFVSCICLIHIFSNRYIWNTRRNGLHRTLIGRIRVLVQTVLSSTSGARSGMLRGKDIVHDACHRISSRAGMLLMDEWDQEPRSLRELGMPSLPWPVALYKISNHGLVETKPCKNP